MSSTYSCCVPSTHTERGTQQVHSNYLLKDGKCNNTKQPRCMVTVSYHQVAEDFVVQTTRFETVQSLHFLSLLQNFYSSQSIFNLLFSATLQTLKQERVNTFYKLTQVVLIVICLYFANPHREFLTYINSFNPENNHFWNEFLPVLQIRKPPYLRLRELKWFCLHSYNS